MKIEDLPQNLVEKLRTGTVIPAHPLALDANRKLDVKHQKALTRYYIDAGAGGLAVGVHTTQFEIREPGFDLFKPVLQLASETVDEYCAKTHAAMLVKIAGVCGKTEQARPEAEFAIDAGYHACLLSLAAFGDDDIGVVLQHCREIAEIMPVIGFYLQPAVGGRVLPYEFWREFAEIENVLAIKIAPFDRYQSLEVVRGVAEAGRADSIALYTGNDDNIVLDLLTEHKVETSKGTVTVRMAGGLLGHWAVWTRGAVQLLAQLHTLAASGGSIKPEILTLAAQITDCNAAFFDTANSFSGCIPGIHEVLRRQGLMTDIKCLDPKQTLSAGQKEEIDRVYAAYPHLSDDAFVKDNLEKWLKD